MFDDIEPDLDVPYLLREVLPPVGVAHIYGKKGSRKSQIAIDLALAVAGAADWCGIPTEHGAVLFSAAEGPAGMKRRIASRKPWPTWRKCSAPARPPWRAS